MLNKKKVILFVLIPIIVILLLVVVFLVNKGAGNKVSKIYDKLIKAHAYTFKMKDTGGNEITIAKKDNSTCIDMNNNGERVTTLVKDDVTYVISHSQREYREYNADIAGETVVTDMLENIKDTEYTTGKEQINGKEYEYEEYAGFAGFITSTNIDFDENNTKTRFYFKGNELAYIKSIPIDGDPELLEVNISYNVPDELFEIPSDYAERENQEY